MNKLMISAAAAAIMLPLSAGAFTGPKDEKMDTTVKTEMQTEMKTDMQMTAVNDTGMAHLSTGSLSAKDLLGEGIRGVNGDRIARIDDIVIDANGQADSVVFLSGGVFGFGGNRGALDFDAVDFSVEGDYEPVVSVSLSEEGVKSAVEYTTAEMNDYSLASELIGAKVDLLKAGDGEDGAVINDIILASNGAVDNLIIQERVIGSIGAGEKYAVPFSKLTIEQGDGGLILNMTKGELEASPTFTSIRANIEHDMNKTWDATKDAVDDAGDEIEDAVQ